MNGYVVDGRIDILVNNDTMKCHPFQGDPKMLFVTYSIGSGERVSMAIKESHKLVLPPS